MKDFKLTEVYNGEAAIGGWYKTLYMHVLDNYERSKLEVSLSNG